MYSRAQLFLVAGFSFFLGGVLMIFVLHVGGVLNETRATTEEPTTASVIVGDPDDVDPCIPNPNSAACKAKETKKEPCAPNGCKCINGIWHGHDGKPSIVDGYPINCSYGGQM